MVRELVLLLIPCILLANSGAESGSSAPSDGGDDAGLNSSLSPALVPLIEPIAPRDQKQIREETQSVRWKNLFRDSSWFLAIEHSFRLATEPGTRQNTGGAPFAGYAQSVRNLHGWSDGDPFYVNYIGHPMQGAAAGYIWVQNDGDYAREPFGMTRRYWKSRLRATAFSWAYSTQFEIGPVSEASIGYIQSRYPQQGLVDHVVTPTVGLGWMVFEDVIDRYLLTTLEQRIQNTWVRIFARGFLNPARSMANMVGGKVPFYRDGRSIFGDGYSEYVPVQETESELPPDVGPAPFELTAVYKRKAFGGPGAQKTCNSGGAEAAFRLSPHWQMIAEVNGCSVGGLPHFVSGDALTYLVGPRWTPSDKRIRPYAQFLIGGANLTTQEVWPEKKAVVEAAAKQAGERPDRDQYVKTDANHGLALSAGMGVDLKLGRTAALKLASLEYTRSWNAPVAGVDYSRGLQLSMGVTLRMGTW